METQSCCVYRGNGKSLFKTSQIAHIIEVLASRSAFVHTSPDMSKHRFSPSVPWVLFLMVMLFFCVYPRLLVSPLLLRIAQGYEVGFDTASRLFLTISVGFVAGLLLSGLVAKRITHRWTVALSVGAGGVFLILASVAPSIFVLHIALTALGVANGMYPGSGIASVANLVPDIHRGKAMAIHETGANFAFIVAPLVAAAFAPIIGWRGAFAGSGVVAVVTAMSFARFGRADSDRGEPPHFKNLGIIVRNKSFWIVSFFLMIAATASMGIFSILPTYLIVDHGFDETFVNAVVGGSRIIAFFAILSGGMLSDRYGLRTVILVILVLTGIATVLIGATGGIVLIASVFLQPAIVGAFFPVAITALTGSVAPNMRNLAVALAIPMANLIGSGIAPTLLSAAGAAGGFRLGFIVVGIIIVASVVMLPIMDPAKTTTR